MTHITLCSFKFFDLQIHLNNFIMKKLILLFVICVLLTSQHASAQQQWMPATDGNSIYYNYNSGNVGIGTSAPTDKLVVLGNISVPLQNGIGFGHSDKFTYDNKTVGNYTIGWYNDSQNTGAPMSYYTGYGGIKFFTQSFPRMIVSQNGNVGVGTSSAATTTNLLTVQGAGTVGTTFQQKITNGTQSLSLGANATAAEVQSQGSVPLYLNYGGNNVILNATSGNVGIGISTPTDKLVVMGAGAVATTFQQKITNGTQSLSLGANATAAEVQSQGSVPLYVNYGGNNVILNATSGNVGIGTLCPDTKLVVKGMIHTDEVKVDLLVGSGCDYVFDNTYKLPPLAEVQNYIAQNKHLPEVPSAKEMEENGMNVKEMNLLLLKKVEEITLYLIQLKNDNETLKKSNETLKDDYERLKMRIKEN
jgi:hypothetical protein